MYAATAFLLAAGATLVAGQAVANSTQPVAITGSTYNINTSTGQRPSRLAIGDLQKSGAGWDLYIQAMSRWQSIPEEDEQSFFQIMGIHGLPYGSWNGAGSAPGARRIGYCPHGDLLFGTWHRPYTALWEQIIAKHAMDIANEYSSAEKSTYVAAAQNLRIPFWDWAVSPALPSAVTSSTVKVHTPQGDQTIRNPLYSYQFQVWPFTNPDFSATTGNYNQSMRCPTTNNVNAKENDGASSSNLNRDARSLTQGVYWTFTNSTTYEVMVTTATGGSSFEQPHNTVHNDIGCGNPAGHMYPVQWSAFDPIFQLHHANIDRLIAMWQAIYYKNPMLKGTYTFHGNTYGFVNGQKFTENSSLLPFYKDTQGSFWSSRDVTGTRVFGYTYPELPDWTMSVSALSASVKQKVNQLYSSSSSSASVSGRSGQIKTADLMRGFQYAAEITADRSELPVPCTVELLVSGSKAGSLAVLTMPMTGMINGIIHLNDVLETRSLLGKEKSTLVPQLQRTIEARVIKADGTVVPVESFPRLSVTLEVTAFRAPASEFEFPTHLNTTKIPVTLPKPRRGRRSVD